MYLLTKQIDLQAPVPILHQALQIAIYDEYRAQATYLRVLERFGPVVPFNNIVHAETRHINALLPLLQRYQVPIPINNWYSNIVLANTLHENCELGVAGEIQNVQMYDHLLSYISQMDIRQTFMNLRETSLTNHLPAFRRCSSPPVYCNSLNLSPLTPLTWLWLLGVGIIIGRTSRKSV
jgi:hypothetical protein